MGKEIRDCVYARTGAEDCFEVVNARNGKYRMASNDETKDAIGECIRENLPTMRGATRHFFESSVLADIDGRKPD